MPYVHIVTALALLQFVWFGIKVGQARERYGVKAPAITGSDVFERHFRVQQNTLELVVIVVPGLYLFSHYFSPLLAAVLGVIYLIGREVYARAYVKDPAKRSAGFGLSALPALILIFGGLAGAVWQLIAH
ncbi:MAG TPA: MAPEG family protein [Steroidobacteraceae bacterium]|jgi:glutathione S-transferase|nr:MAPEG family protein [Steroidobacteraceae bacterium]